MEVSGGANWPEPPDDGSGCAEALYKARLEDHVADRAHARGEQAAERERDWARVKAKLDAEELLRHDVHQARVELAKGAVERGRRGAEFVRNAASALVTIYTGIIGATFAVTKEPLPAAGVTPVAFLAFAIVFAAAYTGWMSRPSPTQGAVATTHLLEREVRRLNSFTDWANELASRRVYCMHAAVLSLGFGCMLLPTVFLSWSGLWPWLVGGLAMACVVLVPLKTAQAARGDAPTELAGAGPLVP